MPLAPGTRLGVYEVIAQIGEGGMGQVYRAHDTALNRDVAIKVLPTEFASDAGRLARFTREAQTLAALNHPNIAHVYGIEGHALVMELVGGEDLSQQIARGPVSLPDALPIAKQIADALEAAHDQGIIHRDLKPANIKVRADGVVKVLDFGLAKAPDANASSATADAMNSPTLTSPAMTQAGMILGTAAYMAPEQARGRVVDRRADIWAFGVVVFEMLTGRHVFPGEDVTDTIVSVVTKEPDWSALPAATPAALRRLLARCLKKDPKSRLRDIGEARVQIDELLSGAPEQSGTVFSVADAGVASAPARSRRIPIAAIAAGLAIAAATGFFASRFVATAPAAVEVAFQQVTDAAGLESEPSISPDGVSVAFTKTVGASSDIYVQRIGGRNAVLVAGDPARAEGGGAFSPDGASIAFHDRTGGGIFIGGATGETIRRLTDFGFHPAWSPNGQQLVFCTEAIQFASSRGSVSSLWIVDVKGGPPRQIMKEDAVQPVWSPSGQRIAYWGVVGGQRDIKTVSADGGVPTFVTHDAAVDWKPVWSADGRWLYFASDRGGSMNLWRVAINDVTGAVRGAPEAVTAGVSAADQPSISKTGSRLAFRSFEWTLNPIVIPFDPSTGRVGISRPLLDRTGLLAPNDVSPNGEWLAISNVGESREDVLVMRTDGTSLRRVTDDAFRDRRPRWSPDGKELGFDSDRNGKYQVWSIKPDGSGLRLVMSLPESDSGSLAFGGYSPEGEKMVASVSGAPRAYLFDPKRSAPDQKPESIPVALPDGSWIVPAAWSPDGRRLAGAVRTSTGANVGLAIYELATRSTRLVADLQPMNGVAWVGQDSHRVVVNAGGDLWLVDVDTNQRKELIRNAVLGPGLAISRDGRTIYASVSRQQSDVWVVDVKGR